jgi:hypothetical protein
MPTYASHPCLGQKSPYSSTLKHISNYFLQGRNEALALVNVHKNPAGPESAGGSTDRDDLRRAKELVELHYEVKARHADGTVDEELKQARRDVQRVLMELSTL